MRTIQVITVTGLLLASAAAAQTTTGQSAADYFRQHASDDSSSSSSASAVDNPPAGTITTSCKALSAKGPIPANIARSDLLKRATDAGCDQVEIDVLMQVYDMTHGN